MLLNFLRRIHRSPLGFSVSTVRQDDKEARSWPAQGRSVCCSSWMSHIPIVSPFSYVPDGVLTTFPVPMKQGERGLRIAERTLIRPKTAPPAHSPPVNPFPHYMPTNTANPPEWPVREVGTTKRSGMRAFIGTKSGTIMYQMNNHLPSK